MAHIKPFTFLLCWFVAATSVVQADTPFELTWSDQTYGPDGPWQAVSVSIGTGAAQTVPLYPGGRWSTYIMLTDICDDKNLTVSCDSDSSSLVSIEKLDTITNITEPNNWDDYGYSSAPSVYQSAIFYDSMNIGYGTSVPNVSMSGVYHAYQTFPGGLVAPVTVGILSMGAPTLNHQWEETMTFITSYMYTDGGARKTPSYSYGMHIGSVALGISGSIYLGGYDKSRLVGEISTQSFTPYGSAPGGNLEIGMMDVGLGVGTGGSPWAYNHKDGLLSKSNSSMDVPITVEVNPEKPYLYLPQSTCDAITAELPVTFNSSLGLYFWDTQDDAYTSITSSAAYLSFTFEKDMTEDANTTIKVPFALLNLTLEDPLVDRSTTYFPCYPVNSSYSLGRSFLQAAFVGENFGNGNGNGIWYLGQAPGPGAAKKDVTSIGLSDDDLPASSSTWEDTWNGYWHPLPGGDDPSSSTGTASSNSSTSHTAAGDRGLSTGAKAGIGVGCGAAGIILIALIAGVLLIRRRRAAAAAQAANANSKPIQMGDHITRQLHPQELEAKPAEGQIPVEVPADSIVRYELG